MRLQINKKIALLFIFFFIATTFLNTAITSFAANNDDIDELNDQIDDKKRELDRINKEIEEQRLALQNASGRATNLQSNINQLESTKNKILSDIKYIETKISETELTINKLNLEIGEKEDLITQNSRALAESVRKIHALKSTSFIEQVLGYSSLAEFWNEFEQTETIKKRLGTEVDTLINTKKELEQKESEKRTEKESLANQKVELGGKKEAIEYTKKEKADLLAQTKNEEANYQRLLAENLAKQKAADAELFDIESKLKTLIDPTGYSAAREGVFSWPVSGFRITQRFGNTAFAKSNPQFYSTGFHNGVDFAVPLGTSVMAPADGVVKGFGNTDAYPGCYSWGKWILIEHANGISSMYGHLSSIGVTKGQKVKRGDIIAQTGSTGVSTGPHLHFTLYITQGVQIRSYKDYAPRATGCGATDVSMPIGSLNSYLDPMDYLPKL